MTTKEIIKGMRFGRWTAMGAAIRKENFEMWCKCKCTCGTVRMVRANALIRKVTPSTSCGCYHREVSSETASKIHTKHGHAKRNKASKEYRTWAGMWRRCTNSKEQNFPRYGDIGISICERWRTFESFLSDMGTAPSPTHSIDRIDSRGNYEPSNCRWATRSEQARNTKRNRLIEWNGVSHIAADWANLTGIKRTTILERIDHRGWSVDRALTEPVHRRAIV